MANEMFAMIKDDLANLEKDLLAAVTAPLDLVTAIGTHLVRAGGKRLRPALFFLSARTGNHYDEADARPLAAALEIVHMASLVHDDVIDHAPLRRGIETANAKWGNKVAILSGDYLFSRSFSLLSTRDYDRRVGECLSELICDLSSGEIMQSRGVYQLPAGEADYEQRIACKTANFLAVCCETGAIVGKAEQKITAAMRQYGYYLGMAFQITDDLLDILSDSQKIGKPVGNDLHEGIITLPVIRALAVSRDKEELARIVSNPEMTDTELLRALEIVRQSDGVEYARQRAADYLAKAKEVLPAEIAPQLREEFLQAADFIGRRES